MVRRLCIAKPLSESTMVYRQLDPYTGKTIQWSFNKNTKIFIPENTFENLFCKIATILVRCHRVKIMLLLVR